MNKKIISILCVLALSLSAFARKAQEGPKTLFQPDGSCFIAELVGDEFSHILRTPDGKAVIKASDGYYYYAIFDQDGKMSNSGVRVGFAPTTKALGGSFDIPYSKLLENAARRKSVLRSNIQKEGETPSVGRTKHGLVILVNFQDVAFRYTRQDFKNLLTQQSYSYNGAKGCAKDYFNDQFNGLYDFDFEVYGPVTVSQNRSYYGGNDSEGSDDKPEEMVIEACRLCDEQVDFSIYDEDGDGSIDNVFVFFAGGDEAEYCGDDCIWSHAWQIYWKRVYLDGVLLDRYACTAELTTTDGGKNMYMASIGTFCHEYTHTFGLWDMYDTDYEKSGGEGKALYKTTNVMDSGSYNDRGNLPPNYSAIERESLGIGECRTLEMGHYSLPPINESNIYYRFESDVEDEYFLLECRKNEGWDAEIGGTGLLIYHIDRSRNSAGKSDGEGRILTARQRWNCNEVNCNPAHQCATILPAYPGASQASQVFFPYRDYNALLPHGKTPLKFWSGETADLSIANIEYVDGRVNFDVYSASSVDAPPEIASVTVEEFQDAAVITFSPDRPTEALAKATLTFGSNAPREFTIEKNSEGTYTLILEDLTPSTSYRLSLYFEQLDFKGPEKSVNVLSSRRNDKGYPYIYLKKVARNADGSFPKGSKIPLRIFNPKGEVDGIFWTLEGKPISISDNGYYILEDSGTLKAEVVYKDGSRCFVVKEMIVK